MTTLAAVYGTVAAPPSRAVRRTRWATIAAALLAFGAATAPAQAQLARTFVSSVNGNDGNNCDRLTPCRTFQHAHDQTLANGEITVLDPGGYGAVTINRAISITNDGVGEAGVLVSGGVNGITVAAGVSDPVALRGLTIKGIGFGGGNGIVFKSGKSLTIENCVVRSLTGTFPIGSGILLQPSGASSFAVSNTVADDNDGPGIAVAPTGSGAVRATFSRVETHNNHGAGIGADGSAGTGTVDVTVADSVSANNLIGFVAGSLPGRGTVTMMVTRSVAANNDTGLEALSAAANATLLVGQSTVAGNNASWTIGLNGRGAVRSYGDNNIDGNRDGNPAPPTISKK